MPLVDASQRHPIIVSQQPQSIEFNIASSSRGLAPQQRADVLEFANHARASDAGNSRLVISAPAGAANEIAAMYAVGEIRQILTDNGFPESTIAVEGYRADGRTAPLRVAYLRYVAQGPPAEPGRPISRINATTSTIRTSAAPSRRTSPPWSPIRLTLWGRGRRAIARASAATPFGTTT